MGIGKDHHEEIITDPWLMFLLPFLSTIISFNCVKEERQKITWMLWRLPRPRFGTAPPAPAPKNILCYNDCQVLLLLCSTTFSNTLFCNLCQFLSIIVNLYPDFTLQHQHKSTNSNMNKTCTSCSPKCLSSCSCEEKVEKSWEISRNSVWGGVLKRNIRSDI